MRLTELEPRWIHPNLFVFLCPHCKQWLLTCKNAVLSEHEQFDLFEKTLGDDWNKLIVPANADCSWTITGNSFDDYSVSPSIDASAAGHWHGHITNGEIK